jgi:hypothetical protein
VAEVPSLDLVDLGPRLVADRAALEQEEPEPALPRDLALDDVVGDGLRLLPRDHRPQASWS